RTNEQGRECHAAAPEYLMRSSLHRGAVESIRLQVIHYLRCFHINDDYKPINIESKDSSCI
ncbi:hypothetical protein Q9966_009070, partial [Columba livia]